MTLHPLRVLGSTAAKVTPGDNDDTTTTSDKNKSKKRKKAFSAGNKDDNDYDANPPRRRRLLRRQETPSSKQTHCEESDPAAVTQEDETSATETQSNEGQEQGDPSSELKPAEAGIIKEIYMENFMCHRKLKVTLGRHINFIHGQNGSGKSAILAALQICLGAQARKTHRAHQLRELIRKDGNDEDKHVSRRAIIRVTLLNEGDDSYKPAIFGNTIIVERVIASNISGNPFKLIGADGVVKSVSKRDLIDMLDKLNIQVDNPVAILSQEDTKHFLQGSGQDKYDFFKRATDLKRVYTSFEKTQDNLQDLISEETRLSKAIDG